jgi:hypothetical protein
MKKIFLITTFILFCGVVYAENKVYIDTEKQLEVVDCSGAKTLEQINKEFNGNFTDITAERNTKAKQDNLLVKEKSDKETLISEKQRELAIEALKAEGKLDDKGNMVKEIK